MVLILLLAIFCGCREYQRSQNHFRSSNGDVTNVNNKKEINQINKMINIFSYKFGKMNKDDYSSIGSFEFEKFSYFFRKDQPILLKVNRVGGSNGDCSVSIKANWNNDNEYQHVIKLNFVNREVAKLVPIEDNIQKKLLNLNITEIKLELYDPTNDATLGANSTTSVFIIDDDGKSKDDDDGKPDLSVAELLVFVFGGVAIAVTVWLIIRYVSKRRYMRTLNDQSIEKQLYSENTAYTA